MLTDAGFDRIELHPALSFDPLQGDEDRIFIIARKKNSTVSCEIMSTRKNYCENII